MCSGKGAKNLGPLKPANYFDSMEGCLILGNGMPDKKTLHNVLFGVEIQRELKKGKSWAGNVNSESGFDKGSVNVFHICLYPSI